MTHLSFPIALALSGFGLLLAVRIELGQVKGPSTFHLLFMATSSFAKPREIEEDSLSATATRKGHILTAGKLRTKVTFSRQTLSSDANSQC